MAIFGELVPSWLYSQLQVIDPITSVHLEYRRQARAVEVDDHHSDSQEK